MSYNVIDDGNNQLIKVAKRIIWDYRYSRGKSNRKIAPVSKTSIEQARDALYKVGVESDTVQLAEALSAIVAEAENNPVQGGLLVSEETIARLQASIKLAQEDDLS